MFKILIADDEELSRSVIRCILEYISKENFFYLRHPTAGKPYVLPWESGLMSLFLTLKCPLWTD